MRGLKTNRSAAAGTLAVVSVLALIITDTAAAAPQSNLAEPTASQQDANLPAGQNAGGVSPDVVVTVGPGFVEGAILLPIPSLNLDGVTANASIGVTDAQHIHEGVFSDGRDLGHPPQVGDPSAAFPCSDPTNAFCSYILSVPPPAHTSSPDFTKVLGQAINGANAELTTKLNPGILADALQVLKTLSGGDSDNVRFAANQPASRFVGYTPEYGRWLRSERLNIFGVAPINYSDPLIMANLRERGARLYCAAREAQNNWQNPSTKSMGKLTAFSVNLFGKKIDFLTVEPTLVIDGPLPFLGGQPGCPVVTGCTSGSPHDGAQAFMVPFLAGTQITPVSLLPSLPEIQVPVVMVTGDSEVLTPGGSASIGKTYQTVTHSDAILSSEATGGAASKTLLYSIGPVKIFMDLGMGYGVGQLFSDESIGTPDTSVSVVTPPAAPQMVSPLPNDRLLDNVPSFGLAPRAGAVSFPFDDSAWAAPSAFTANTTANQTMVTEPTNDPPFPPSKFLLQPYNPFLIRGLEDDDRQVWNSTTLGLLGGVHGELPAHFDVSVGGVVSGSIDATISAGGDVTVNAAMRHTLRDAALFLPEDAAPPIGPGKPISAVTIEPSVSASGALDLFVDLDLTAQIDVFGFTKTVTIFNGHVLNAGPITLAKWDSGPWPEASRFRLGTGAPDGDPLKAPVVPSHFPNSGLFESFPAGNDVDTCLANPADNVPAPPPCAAQPPVMTTPPSGEMCAYAAGPPNAPPLPPNVCMNVAAYVNKIMLPPATAAQRKCAIDKFTFLCQPISEEQNFGGMEVVARIFDITNQAEMTSVQQITQECVQAYPALSAQQVAQQLFSFGVCNNAATLLTSSQAVSLAGAPTVDPGSCQ